MIGNDPRYQTIIDAYRRGEFDAPYQSMDYTPSPYYNPIYDIRREQIEAGELEEGARFPRPQIDTSQPPASPEAPIDPCPPGYQLIDGVCQPDSMFEQQDRGGRDQQFTGPKITDGVIEGYQELEPMQQKMGTFYQSLSPEMKEEYEKASSYGRGLQYKTDAQGNVIRIVAKSPTFGQLMGDIGGGLGSMFGGIGEAAKEYLTGGGILGSIISAFTPQPPTVSYGGTSDISVSTQPMISPDIIAPTGIVRPGYPMVQPTVQPAAPTGIVRPGYGLPTPQIDVVSQQKLQQQQALAAELEKQRQADLAAQQAAQQAASQRQAEIKAAEERARQAQQSGGTPRQGTGASGPPGRSGGSSRTERAAPRQVNISSSAYSGRGYTRGR